MMVYGSIMIDHAPADPEDYYSSLPPPKADRRVRELYGYWRAIHPPGGGLPGRQHLDPVDIPSLLTWIWLIDVVRAPLRFRHRLIGTEHVRVMERDVTGQWLDVVYPRFQTSPAYQQFIACAERGETQYRSGLPLFHQPRELLSMERLLLPLARDGSEVNMILAITVYHSR
jgi:hypothetical protein